MEWESLTEDQLDQTLIRAEQEIARWRAIEMAVIREKRARRSHLADGYRSLVDWFAAHADVSHETARKVCWTASRIADDGAGVEAALATGEISFDRAEQLARLPEPERADHQGLDISQLQRKVAHYRRLSGPRERETAAGFLNFGPSPDETARHVWGRLPGVDSKIVEKAIDQRSDEIIGSEVRLPVAERRAMALVAICHDSLYSRPPESTDSPTLVTVTVDARAAVPSNGEAGVAVLAGPRIGVKALEAITCDAIVEVIGIAEDGEPLSLGRKRRTVSPSLRRFILTRDAGCVSDGCTSRYRLEAHHTTHWDGLGETNPDNLVTLCWFHHHVAVHRHGLVLEELGRSRYRLRRPS